MKPESIKSILRSYLQERQHSLRYDDRQRVELESAKPSHVGDSASDLLNQVPQYPDFPLDELNVPLEPHLEALARGVGHQLNRIVDGFEEDRIYVVHNRASTNGNRIFQFREHIICVPPTCDRVQIPVIRTRAAGGVVNATWRTCDKSAVAGFHYVNNQGSISFARGDEEKTIEVEIIRDQDRRNDIHFAVELYDAEGIFDTLMIYIRDDSRLYPEENRFIQYIFNRAPNISMSEIVFRLRGNVTHNTFKAALLCLSNCADSIPTKELALGAELLRLTIPQARFSLLTNAFCEFFSYLPELVDIWW